MERRRPPSLSLLIWWLAAIISRSSAGDEVTYDGRSLIINGQRKLLFSGSIHYTRSTPQMWPSLIKKAKEGGLDVIDTYVFWNSNEPQQGQYDFSGRNDIVGFIKQVHTQGLYVCLRIGPFIESEWKYGGLPIWLRDVPGIVFRSDNQPFKFHMQTFTTKIVNLLKSQNLFASQGGPIILSQIENEYQMVEPAFHEKGPPYVRWAAAMAVGLQTGVPWLMCKQDDAPDPVINACNGMRCGETFSGPNSPNKPAIWTENWTHFYDAYGKQPKIRSPQDLAFHTALFIVTKKGSFINYYMYHGGTNFGRTSSAFALTSYYDQAPLDEYGLKREPKWSHLKALHAAVKQCSDTLLYGTPSNISLGILQEAYVYQQTSGKCAAFLVNTHSTQLADVQFMNSSYQLPPKSISILPDCKTVAFNTAQVTARDSTRLMKPVVKLDSAGRWKEWKEAVPVFSETPMKASILLEQMSTTKDESDYLWYTTNYEATQNSASVLSVQSLGHVLRAYVNGVLVGSGHGSHSNTSFSLDARVPFNAGVNQISLLSAMVGLPDSGAYLERKAAGLKGVSIQENVVGLPCVSIEERINQVVDLNNYSWGYQVGLTGEKLKLYTEEGSRNGRWTEFSPSTEPLTWYQRKFDAAVAGGDDPIAINLGSMGKGQVWINGQSIGRYWVSFHTPDGSPSQIWYHIPTSFLKPTDNLLVLFEEETGNPLGISIDAVSVTY